MAANRNRRLGKEIQDVQKDTQSGITLKPSSAHNQAEGVFDDLSHFHGVFQGPPDTPYEGGTFVVDIQIPDEYPFHPPTMKFITRIWHPNVSSVTGAICLDTLGKAWSPILTIKSALISLQSLLSSPEPKDPQDAEVARMMLHDPEAFAAVAREWAIKHAGAPIGILGASQGMSSHDRGNARDATAEGHRSPKKVDDLAQYRGYNKAMVEQFTNMGFELHAVVDAFDFVGIEIYDGRFYEMEEEYMGDITARLLHEP